MEDGSSSSSDDAQKVAADKAAAEWQDLLRARIADDVEHDQLKADYAEHLSNVSPSTLRLTYTVVSECALLHQDHPPNPAQWREPPLPPLDAAGNVLSTAARARLREQRLKAAAAAAANQQSGGGGGGGGSGRPRRRRPRPETHHRDYDSIRQLLLAKFPDEAVLGPKDSRRRMTQRACVEKIMSTDFNSSSPAAYYGGFVTLEGGWESRTDDGLTPGGTFAFCHQRTQLERPEEQVGRFTHLQARHLWPDNTPAQVRAKVARQAGRLGTLSRGSFPTGVGAATTLSLDLFRFLVVERGLVGYRLRHFCYYSSRHSLTPYIEQLVQLRHDLKRRPDGNGGNGGGGGGNELLGQVYKLLFNGKMEKTLVRGGGDSIRIMVFSSYMSVRLLGLGILEILPYLCGARELAGPVSPSPL